MARGKHFYSGTELRKFRKQVSALKKAGIIPASVDARSAQPYFVRSGITLRDYVKNWGSATEGKAEIVKLPKKDAAKYKKLGWTVKGDKVLVVKTPDESVSVKDGQITIKSDITGIRRIQITTEIHNLSAYLKNLRETADEMKSRGEYFSFAYFGNHTHKAFSDIDLLLEYLERYESVVSALNKRSARDAREIIQNLEIVIGRKEPIKKFIEIRGAGKKRRKTGAQTRANWPEWKKEEYKKKRRAEEKKRYEKKKGKK